MTPTASELFKKLESQLPQWPTGLAGRGLMLRHLESILPLPQSCGLTDTAYDVTLWRWQLFPWDLRTISLVTALSTISGRSSVPEWAKKSHAQGSPHFLKAIGAIADAQTESVAHLWRSFGAASGDLAWLSETCLFFLQRGEEALARMVLDSTTLPDNHPLRAQLGALLAYCVDPPENALGTIRQLPEDFRWIRTLLEAQCLLRMGDVVGVDSLKNLWRDIPWHPNLTLKLHELLATPLAPTPVDANTAVLLYSWNNADLLQQTLLSLSQSDLGAASVFVLDNGSHDHTPEVIRTAFDLFGQRLKSLCLPVNIGAPAARNWLLRHPEMDRFDTVIFVDDDVLLPPEWLTGLTRHFRQAGKDAVVGCRIMDQPPRQTVQMADVNLLDIEADGNFLIANAGSGELDLGLHSYTRPCLSVTGCCHMMDRHRAEKLGGFDLRFGPSQFDDFDLDLRNVLQGGRAFYTGTTGIRHCQRSSLRQANSEAKQGHIQGNMIKLNSKYSAEQKAELLRNNRELLWDDLLTKTRDLENL